MVPKYGILGEIGEAPMGETYCRGGICAKCKVGRERGGRHPWMNIHIE